MAGNVDRRLVGQKQMGGTMATTGNGGQVDPAPLMPIAENKGGTNCGKT